nr:disease resistance protein RPS6-like [Ziziphus jujuba var. spinosa]
MHDLLRQVGHTIVCDEHREPGKRSRLWDVKDVCHVLERNMGTAAVEGISFNMSEISKDIKMCHASFSEMYNLRFLKFIVTILITRSSNCTFPKVRRR